MSSELLLEPQSTDASPAIPRARRAAPLLKEEFALSNVAAATVRVIGAGRLAMAVAQQLAELGLEIASGDVSGDVSGSAGFGDAEIAICALEQATYAQFEEVTGGFTRAGIPTISIAVEGDDVMVGPLTMPGRHGGFLSARVALAVNALAEPVTREELEAALPAFTVGSCEDVEPWIVAAACHQAARMVLAALRGPTPRTTDSVIVDRQGAHPVELPLPPRTASRAKAPATTGDMVLIVGSQRSGTTMLGNHLASAYELTYYDEDEAYTRLNRESDPSANGLSLFKIPILTAALSFLRHHFPYARYLYLRRPLLQVTASMLSLRGFDGLSWADRFAMDEIRTAIASWPDRSAAGELHRELTQCDQPYQLAAYCAFLKTSWHMFYESAGVPLLTVDYDDVTRNPGETIARVAEFIGSRRRPVVMGASNSVLIGQTESGRAIDAGSRAKYQRVLSSAQIDEIQALETHWRTIIAGPRA